MKLETCVVNINGEHIEFKFRPVSAGDKGVLQQIFGNEDYRVAQWTQGRSLLDYYAAREKRGETLIVDAGANIGASAVYFSKLYRSSVVLAVEPEENNLVLSRINIDGIPNVKVFPVAIGCEKRVMYLDHPGSKPTGVFA